MIKDKLISAKNTIKDYNLEIGLGAVFIGVAALAIKYPEAFVVEEEIPTMKIIHVHEYR